MYSAELVQVPIGGSELLVVAGQLNQQIGWWVLDTGSARTIVQRAQEKRPEATHALLDGDGQYHGAQAENFTLRVGEALYSWEGLGLEKLPFEEVFREAGKECPLGLLGLDWCTQAGATLNFSRLRLRWRF